MDTSTPTSLARAAASFVFQRPKTMFFYALISAALVGFGFLEEGLIVRAVSDKLPAAVLATDSWKDMLPAPLTWTLSFMLDLVALGFICNAVFSRRFNYADVFDTVAHRAGVLTRLALLDTLLAFVLVACVGISGAAAYWSLWLLPIVVVAIVCSVWVFLGTLLAGPAAMLSTQSATKAWQISWQIMRGKRSRVLLAQTQLAAVFFAMDFVIAATVWLCRAGEPEFMQVWTKVAPWTACVMALPSLVIPALVYNEPFVATGSVEVLT